MSGWRIVHWLFLIRYFEHVFEHHTGRGRFRTADQTSKSRISLVWAHLGSFCPDIEHMKGSKVFVLPVTVESVGTLVALGSTSSSWQSFTWSTWSLWFGVTSGTLLDGRCVAGVPWSLDCVLSFVSTTARACFAYCSSVTPSWWSSIWRPFRPSCLW